MSVQPPVPALPTLDTSGETWVGTFPGLGQVAVHADGRCEVRVAPHVPAGPDRARAERALRLGWAEPLGLARTGHHLVRGTALVAAGSGRALLVTGPIHDTTALGVALVGQGWLFLADGVCPTTWDDDVLLAQGRAAPMLASARRAQAHHLEHQYLGPDTSTVEIPAPRATGSFPVAAVLVARARKAGDPDGVLPLRGHARFQAACDLMVGGVLGAARHDGPPDPGTLMQRHLKLAGLPFGQVHPAHDAVDDAVTEVVRWWDGTTQGGPA